MVVSEEMGGTKLFVDQQRVQVALVQQYGT
jgi:hypothetical protein